MIEKPPDTHGRPAVNLKQLTWRMQSRLIAAGYAASPFENNTRLYNLSIKQAHRLALLTG
ncbi:hypothetical protein BN8_02318 [Fibrisoma limi BUZ 3]|uniref:Uncharacterized protein n=1 Tax=Fibrisoma limi BUZ 3 TaxID=1185876 RepID=I2GH64_9BACT|nr:hypothetical protein BN8_02318 [Fibrisoma limi BUZ 3]